MSELAFWALYFTSGWLAGLIFVVWTKPSYTKSYDGLDAAAVMFATACGFLAAAALVVAAVTLAALRTITLLKD